MSTPNPLFDELFSELLDGELDAEERAQLVDLIRNDPRLLQEARRQLAISGEIAKLRPELSDRNFLAAMSTHLRAVGDENPDDFPARVAGRIQRARRRTMTLTSLALAACVLLATVPVLFLKRSTPSLAKTVAVAISLPDAGGGKARTESVQAGREIHLDAGRMRLEFQNGAVVAVESPASFTITSGEQIDLHQGNLNAWCPESAHGFRINTRTAQLKDLGTSFGVSVGKNGTSDFLVLEGKVEVSNQGAFRTVPKGEAVRASSRQELETLDFEPSAFSRTWPLASGIENTHGAVIPAPPNTPEIVAAHEDDRHIIVIPELRDIELPQSIDADITEPGLYEGGTVCGPHPLISPPGRRGRSFLLRYNPVGIVDVTDFKRFEGSVTFDRPVLAIVTSPDKLDASDHYTSAAPLPATEEDLSMRGLEGAQPPNPTDGVQLSTDRRTVSVIFWAGESVDEIRVITAED
ncbi:FecR domain-containing protein [Haloferula sargassicola]|uniref:FecR protein domain-containing protein n=1 Tax=Haloferula sargassicola TaxID=490096 RepID=A0ABP9UH05_9BACT